MTQDRFEGGHPNAVTAQLAKEAKERQQRRKAWLKTADTRRSDYLRIVALSTVELIEMVAYLGGGDDYDGCFTEQGQVELAFAKRTLRVRVRSLEAEVAQLREELRDIAEDTDADNPNSYRSDDREGCLDWVHAKAMKAGLRCNEL